jgi:hypothetical protein
MVTGITRFRTAKPDLGPGENAGSIEGLERPDTDRTHAVSLRGVGYRSVCTDRPEEEAIGATAPGPRDSARTPCSGRRALFLGVAPQNV